MPVVGMNVSERPPNPVQSETLGYLCICVNVVRIIVINEVTCERLPKN